MSENTRIRSQNMFQLLQQVRLAVVKPDYLANIIATFPACKSSSDCQQLINKAALYHYNQSKSIRYDVREVKLRGFRSRKIYIFRDNSSTSFVNGNYEKLVYMSTTEFGRDIAVLNGKVYLTGGLRLDGDSEGVMFVCLMKFMPFLLVMTT